MSGSLSQLSSLLANSSIDDHEEVLKAANEALKKNKTDVQAQCVRAVALLKLDRYADAVKTYEDGNDALRSNGRLAYAYALYKCGRLDEAAQVAGGAGDDVGLQHVEAQAKYKSEHFKDAQGLYEGLAKADGRDSESDLRINQGAIDAQLSWYGHFDRTKKRKVEREDMEQFETAYNAACGYIARGELAQASKLLTMARSLCNALDELSEEEKMAELLPITVQQIYVHARLGQTEEANKLASSLNPTDIVDLSTRHIAQANKLSIQPATKNPFLSHRQFNETANSPKGAKPFGFQSVLLNRNSMVLDQQVGKSPSPQTNNSRSDASGTLRDASLRVFAAAAAARGQTGTMAIKEMLPVLEKSPDSIGLLLTIVHLYLLTDNAQAAANLLDKYLARLEQTDSDAHADARFAPGLVALRVSLDRSLRRTAHAETELAKASKHWRHKSRPRAQQVPLFVAAATELLDSPDEADLQDARSLFDLVREFGGDDRVIAAGMAASTVSADGGEADLSEKLSNIEDLTSGIDAASLEAAGIAKPAQPSQPSVKAKRPADETAAKTMKPKKIRKSLMPKDFDPNKKMDPERWLPLRDRSNYRPKGKKKGKATTSMLTQGGTVSEDSRPATPSQQPQQQKAGQANKKKKGKK